MIEETESPPSTRRLSRQSPAAVDMHDLWLAYRSGVPWNETEYANPEFDKLLSQAEGILDATERQKVLAQIEQIMQEDGPLVQPVWRNNFTFMAKQVKGFTMHPSKYIFGNKLAIES